MVGRVRKALDAKGVSENTLLVFSGDNGYYQGQRGFAGKWSHYEESLRVPLIIYDPNISPNLRGRTAPQMALNIDLPATFIDYADLPLPKSYHGRSLRPIIEGIPPENWRNDTFCEHLMDYGGIPKWEGVQNSIYLCALFRTKF